MNTAVDHFTPMVPPKREMPHNFDAEQALLGAILVNNLAYQRVSEFLKAEHFATNAHAQIYYACAALIEKGQVANPLTLKNSFDQNSELDAVGGAMYLARLAASATTIINAADYGRIVFDTCMRRCLIRLGEDTVNEAYDQYDTETSWRDVAAVTELSLTNLMSEGTLGGGPVPILEGLDASIAWTEKAYRSGGGVTGVPTGLVELDGKIGGLRAGNLIIVGARPGMGKSTVAAALARGAAEAMLEDRIPENTGKGVAIFSMEMTKEEWSSVLLASHTEIAAENQLNGRINENDFQRLSAARHKLGLLPIFIDDTPALTVANIRSRCRALKRKGKLGLVVVDYLQLVKPEGRRPSGNRTEDVSAISRGLKELAKELGVPVVALSQLSRNVEQRDNKRPIMADLRESGAIEQDADIILFIYRAEYYLQQNEPALSSKDRADWEAAVEASRNITELIIPKARLGRTGTVKIYYKAAISRVGNLSDRPSEFEESLI